MEAECAGAISLYLGEGRDIFGRNAKNGMKYKPDCGRNSIGYLGQEHICKARPAPDTDVITVHDNPLKPFQ